MSRLAQGRAHDERYETEHEYYSFHRASPFVAKINSNIKVELGTSIITQPQKQEQRINRRLRARPAHESSALHFLASLSYPFIITPIRSRLGRREVRPC